ncbi:hypothetical protein BpHYR1_053193 [Brachionus plicatilis]|uniref:SHSP domain-containing protein n=1 Tax=Brachionus plicatilis TaxID=10195 RepID=A0A3M7STH7_BRAPC|nr:hypothetical protein BpHYR1_053193 [Brachionus plicatilis]
MIIKSFLLFHAVTKGIQGDSADSLKVKVSDDKQKLIVSGKEGGNKSDDDDYHIRKFKKSYKLAPNAEMNKIIRFK